MKENWLTANFKNCVHQQKKALHKSTKSVINRKSVSTSHNDGFLEKCDFTGPKSYFHSRLELTLQNFARRHFFDVNVVSIATS